MYPSYNGIAALKLGTCVNSHHGECNFNCKECVSLDAFALKYLRNIKKQHFLKSKLHYIFKKTHLYILERIVQQRPTFTRYCQIKWKINNTTFEVICLTSKASFMLCTTNPFIRSRTSNIFIVIKFKNVFTLT